MKDLLFMLADIWMIFTGLYYGWKFIREYGNYLLGLEWMIVGSSGMNFLLWALVSGEETSIMFHIAHFLDSFSRAVGITLILVLGLMRVTHLYKPSKAVDISVFAVGILAGLYLVQYPVGFHVGPATFYLVVNSLTALFLFYFIARLWKAGITRHAVSTAIVVIASLVITITYDFFPIPGDDEHRTIFYIFALATWGTMMCVFYYAYRALHNYNVEIGIEPKRQSCCTPKAAEIRT